MTAGRRTIIRMSDECQEVRAATSNVRATVIGLAAVMVFWLLIICSKHWIHSDAFGKLFSVNIFHSGQQSRAMLVDYWATFLGRSLYFSPVKSFFRILFSLEFLLLHNREFAQMNFTYLYFFTTKYYTWASAA